MEKICEHTRDPNPLISVLGKVFKANSGTLFYLNTIMKNECTEDVRPSKRNARSSTQGYYPTPDEERISLQCTHMRKKFSTICSTTSLLCVHEERFSLQYINPDDWWRERQAQSIRREWSTVYL